MKAPDYRLPQQAGSRFSGHAIDRGRPIAFRLDGRSFPALEGDTVLSALAASGVDTAGMIGSHGIALDARFCPPVVPRHQSGDRRHALPPDRLPVVDGLDLISFGVDRPAPSRLQRGIGWAQRLIRGPSRSLDFDFATAEALPGPWVDQPAGETLSCDVAVIGGGVAGMAAAVAAATEGATVLLVERRHRLGGDAQFFGTVDGEERPDEAVMRLREAIAGLDNITVLLFADVMSLWSGRMRVHQVEIVDGEPRGRVIAVEAPRIVVATGVLERLPVSPGNRLPGVIGARAAFDLASGYGVWPGRSAAVHTSTNAATQVALLAADAGVEVVKLTDSRPDPGSRFFEFAKAYGISLAPGLMPVAAMPATKAPRRLSVTYRLSLDAPHAGLPVLEADRLVVCGGWQPDLLLWQMAGGRTRWRADSTELVATGEIEGVALAGACAGLRSMTACMESGREAAARLFGRAHDAVEERFFNPDYETLDGPLTVAPADAGPAPSYFDAGTSLAVNAPPPARRRFSFRPVRRAEAGPRLIDQPKALTLGDVAARVVLGEIPPRLSGAVAQERCVVPGRILGSDAPVEPIPAAGETPEVPAWLAARFGDDARVVTLASPDGRSFDPGMPLFPNTDATDPRQAIGAVLRSLPDGGSRALVAAVHAASGRELIVQGGAGPVEVRIS